MGLNQRGETFVDSFCSCQVANAISNPMAVYDLAANSMCLKIDYSILQYYNVN